MTTIHEVSTSFLEDTKEDAETGNSAWQILKDNKIQVPYISKYYS